MQFSYTVSCAQADAAAPLAGGGAGEGVAAYKAAAGATIDEYFASGEAGEVVRRLVELDEPALANMFVKQARCYHFLFRNGASSLEFKVVTT